MQKALLHFKMKKLAMLDKERELFQYKSGDVVYIISPLTSQLRTTSQKISVKYVVPVAIYKITDPKSFLLCTRLKIITKFF